MMILQIETVNGYKPHPDFCLRIDDDGRIIYTGRSFVGVVGDRVRFIEDQSIQEIVVLSEYLVSRNQKNYLKTNLEPAFSVDADIGVKTHFNIDRKDVVSEDIINQIIELAGAGKWIKAALDLYLVMSKPDVRTRELGVLRAGDHEQAISMYLSERSNRHFRSEDDFIAIPIGVQKPGTILSPVVYFSFSDYQIHERSSKLLLNLGPKIDSHMMSVFLFISFGKRYNDSTASYFIVLGKDKKAASNVFQQIFPHFMPRDFQQVDLEVNYIPNPLFETYIPIAIR